MVSGTSPPVSALDISTQTSRYDVVLLTGTNSITVMHNLGRLAKMNNPFCTDDNANLLKIVNEGVNSFDIALPAGMLSGGDMHISGTFV